MADETQLIKKRQRVDEEVEQTLIELDEGTTVKRHKSYNHIISFLDSEEKLDPEEPKPVQDLSSFITTLQQELSDAGSGDSAAAEGSPVSEEDDRERVFRHLLEASDDELGLPTKTEDSGESVNSEDNNYCSVESLTMEGFSDFGDANLWEIEDEAANYYTLLQSELFM